VTAVVDLIINGTVVTCDDGDRVMSDGAIAIEGDRIVAVGQRDDIAREWTARRVSARPDAILMPGMVDAHTHSAQSMHRSLIAGELPMIHRLYLPGEDAMTDADLATAVDVLTAQYLRCGITTFAESAASTRNLPIVEDAVRAAGVRCLLAAGRGDQDFSHVSIYGQTTSNSWARVRPGDTDARLTEMSALLDHLPPDSTDLVRGSVLASHLTSCSPDLVRASAALAADRGAVWQVHVARDREEVEFSLAVLGARPVQVLAEWGVLGPATLAIHAILAVDQEIALLGQAGAAVAHAPAEALNILNRIPPVQRIRAAGVTVGLACDNAINDGWEVMRVALGIHAAVYGITDYDAEHLLPREVLRMMTIDSARALGWADQIGSLEVGKQADVVVIDGTAPHLGPTQDVVADLVRYCSRAEVRDVYVAGVQLLDDAVLVGVDPAELRARAGGAAARIRDAVSGRRYRPLR
jgi:5-methylthioadenosine/S-adenosylhomocysteine deaminase